LEDGLSKHEAAITAIKQARSAPEEPVYHLRQFGDVTKEQLDRYMATGDINPQPAPVQEPDHGNELTIVYMLGLHDGKKKRQWVGLTDEEFEDIELGCRSTSSGKIEAMQKVEAKLKEKNNG
jgi:hypothetical protein